MQLLSADFLASHPATKNGSYEMRLTRMRREYRGKLLSHAMSRGNEYTIAECDSVGGWR